MDKRTRDKLQYSAFHSLFKIRYPDFGVEQAFASAIVDTGDDVFDDVIERRPDLVDVWLRQYGEVGAIRKTRKLKRSTQ